MNYQGFVYVTTAFDFISLLFNVPGSYVPGCQKSKILLCQDSKCTDKEAKYRNTTYKVEGSFSSDTDFKEKFTNEYADLKNLYLVDANDLTKKQIKDLKTIVDNKKCNVFVFSHKFYPNSLNITQTYKQLLNLGDNIILKKIVFSCPCGTYNVDLSEHKDETKPFKEYIIHGKKYYTVCNLRCEEVYNEKDQKLFLENNLRTEKMKEFLGFLKNY